jgi:hypothetical protein
VHLHIGKPAKLARRKQAKAPVPLAPDISNAL